MMECRYCGHWLPDDSKYCQYCGRKIEIAKGNNTIPIETDDKQKNTVSQDLAIEETVEDIPFHYAPQVQANFPIVLEQVKLKKDIITEQVLASCTFKSLSRKVILAMQIDVLCYNIGREALEGVSAFEYSDLHINRDDCFGNDCFISMPDSGTRVVEIQVRRMVFEDGTIIERTGENVPVPAQETLEQYFHNGTELVHEYKAKTNKTAEYAPVDMKCYWLCSCRGINYQDEGVCHKCGVARGTAFSALDRDTLLFSIWERQEREAKERRLQQEREAEERRIQQEREAEEKAKERENELLEEQKKEAKKAYNRKAAKIFALVAIGIGAIIALVFCVIKPAIIYHRANEKMNAGEYSSAYADYRSLGNYRNSHEMMYEALYQKSVAYVEQGVFLDAAEQYEALGDYKDSASRAKEAYYSYAGELADSGKLHEAYELYSDKITGYKDSQDLACKAEYQYALNCYEEERYEEAANAFGNIESYEDSAELKTEANYLLAIKLASEGSYLEAYDLFMQISDYKDSDKQMQECYYQYGLTLLSEEEYEEANTVFESLGNFKDSEKQLQAAKYGYACSRVEQKDYATAVELFEELGWYKDSHDQYLAAMYAYANLYYSRSNTTTNKYLTLLKQNGYKDSAQLYKDLYS